MVTMAESSCLAKISTEVIEVLFPKWILQNLVLRKQNWMISREVKSNQKDTPTQTIKRHFRKQKDTFEQVNENKIYKRVLEILTGAAGFFYRSKLNCNCGWNCCWKRCWCFHCKSDSIS